MSKIDDTFNESVLRLQGWLHFLERKESEYQRQLNRVRGGSGPATSSPEAAPEAGSADEGDAWQ